MPKPKSGDFQRRPGRLLVVDRRRWKWRLGRGFSIIAHSDDGKRACADVCKVKKVDPYVFERGQHKKTRDGALTPREVARWLSSLA